MEREKRRLHLRRHVPPQVDRSLMQQNTSHRHRTAPPAYTHCLVSNYPPVPAASDRSDLRVGTSLPDARNVTDVMRRSMHGATVATTLSAFDTVHVHRPEASALAPGRGTANARSLAALRLVTVGLARARALESLDPRTHLRPFSKLAWDGVSGTAARTTGRGEDLS